MLFYYCWFNAELVLHSRADRRQLFSLAKWSCLLSVRRPSPPPPPPPPPPRKACMWISTSSDWITVAWEQRESRLIMQCLSDRFGNILDLCVSWSNVTMLWLKNECALVSQDHEEEEEDCKVDSWKKKSVHPQASTISVFFVCLFFVF